MSNIKIQDVAQRIQYTATNLQTVFAVPFPFFATTDLVVYQGSTVLNLGAAPGEYGVSGEGSPSGGSVTFVTGATTGDIITIFDNLAIDRTSIYSATISNLTGSDLNGDFNREVVMLKQLETEQSLLQLQYYPYAEVSQDPTVTIDRWIPILSSREAWRMNAAGTAIETFEVPDGDIAPAAATYITQTVNAFLPNSQALSSLTTGFLSSTTATGVIVNRTLTGTTNQIDIANGDGSGVPTFTLSSTMDAPGTFTVGGTLAINAIIDDDSMATATATNLPSSESVVAYVTAQVGNYLPLAGGTMSGAIAMGTNKITGLGDPTANQDAATKIYVDTTNVSPLTTKGDLYTFSTVNDRLPVGATDGQMIQVLAAAATGLAWSTAAYPVTAGTIGNVLTSDGTDWTSSAPVATQDNYQLAFLLGGM